MKFFFIIKNKSQSHQETEVVNMERLLQLLEENARLSVEDLAAMLSSTPP